MMQNNEINKRFIIHRSSGAIPNFLRNALLSSISRSWSALLLLAPPLLLLLLLLPPPRRSKMKFHFKNIKFTISWW